MQILIVFFPFSYPTRGIKEVIKIWRAPDFLRELTKRLFFSDSFALVSRFFLSCIYLAQFSSAAEISLRVTHGPSEPIQGKSKPRVRPVLQNLLKCGAPVHSLAMFGLIPQSGDKSPVNLGHTRTVTKEQHRLCVLWLLLKDSLYPAGKNGFILQECTLKKKKIKAD